MRTDESMKKVRTRFAPSPTGSLHIGGARTALFNWLFARRHGGAFVLRIDDTDAGRSQTVFEDEIIRAMRWLGIDWDEGPEIGGAFAPYRQSERIEIYGEWVRKLTDTGAAYPCYCSEERLEELRRQQLASGMPPRYDGRCRSGVEASVGAAPCIRFAMPGVITLHDALHGEFTLRDAGDFIIQRSNGMSVYLFTSVIDDYLMEITHVIRGDEHLPNAARQLAIFDALGLPSPVFAHIPMILGADRHKLSKRTGSLPISVYRERGFYPEAMCAYLATLSHPEIADGTADLDALARGFSLEKISSSAPVHDEEHLLFHQRRAMSVRDITELRRELFSFEPEFSDLFVRNPAAFDELLSDVRNERATVNEISDAVRFLIIRPECVKLPFADDLAEMLCALPDWKAETLNDNLRAFMKSRAVKPKEFFHPIRLALSAQDKGSPLPLVMAVLGRDECIGRILCK